MREIGLPGLSSRSESGFHCSFFLHPPYSSRGTFGISFANKILREPPPSFRRATLTYVFRDFTFSISMDRREYYTRYFFLKK